MLSGVKFKRFKSDKERLLGSSDVQPLHSICGRRANVFIYGNHGLDDKMQKAEWGTSKVERLRPLNVLYVYKQLKHTRQL